MQSGSKLVHPDVVLDLALRGLEVVMKVAWKRELDQSSGLNNMANQGTRGRLVMHVKGIERHRVVSKPSLDKRKSRVGHNVMFQYDVRKKIGALL